MQKNKTAHLFRKQHYETIAYRAEFVRLVESASMLANDKPAFKDASEKSTAIAPADKSKQAFHR